MKTITIALDAMGGDHGPRVTVAAALRILKKYPTVSIILVGDQSSLRDRLKVSRFEENDRLTIIHASQRVEMDEPPAQALRYKKDSSMRVAINLVKAGTAQAMVSAGNTGALMATAHFVLKMIEGVDRPAMVSVMPAKKVPTLMLDLGANVDSSPENLFQFAVMGAELAAARGCAHPRVALLNIGQEEIKGNSLVKQAHRLLLQVKDDFQYVGFVEANMILAGNVDVIVCDGFVGNVALKAVEGTGKIILSDIKRAFYRTWLTRIIGLAARWVLRPLTKQYTPDESNGASLLGLRGAVIKSHGNANSSAFANAIEKAIIEVDANVTDRIHARVRAYLQERGAE